MRKSHFNDEFLVLLGPIISRLSTCSNVEKKVLALDLSLWLNVVALDVMAPFSFFAVKFADETFSKSK